MAELKPRLLDLFCGAGGAAMGYHQAGFDVVGVDINPQPNYPFEFHQLDALDFLEAWLRDPWGIAREAGPHSGFDAIHASPPCQAYTGVPFRRSDHPGLLPRTREFLKATGLPYVIENVPTAPMEDSIVLCGTTFGLPIVRHRRFEVNPPIGLVPSLCHQTRFDRGTEHEGTYPYAHGAWRPAWREHVLPVVWPWMTLEEAGEAIPPAYTEFIGAHLLAHLEMRAAA